ncbi:hypothetical protein [Streptomyces sp. NPDC057438]|uniref:hypothetical protein n=1 Tax=Streptomyces sp. NPDC057438 TaxID=3346133 RepID=UPI0036AF9D1D
MAATKTGDVRTSYLEGRSIAVLARDHGVSRGASILPSPTSCPDHTAIEEDALAPELSVTFDMPGKVADFPSSADRSAGSSSVVRKSVLVVPAQRKVQREYEKPRPRPRSSDLNKVIAPQRA